MDILGADKNALTFPKPDSISVLTPGCGYEFSNCPEQLAAKCRRRQPAFAIVAQAGFSRTSMSGNC